MSPHRLRNSPTPYLRVLPSIDRLSRALRVASAIPRGAPLTDARAEACFQLWGGRGEDLGVVVVLAEGDAVLVDEAEAVGEVSFE
jgi:hypothetical protein